MKKQQKPGKSSMANSKKRWRLREIGEVVGGNDQCSATMNSEIFDSMEEFINCPYNKGGWIRVQSYGHPLINTSMFNTTSMYYRTTSPKKPGTTKKVKKSEYRRLNANEKIAGGEFIHYKFADNVGAAYRSRNPLCVTLYSVSRSFINDTHSNTWCDVNTNSIFNNLPDAVAGDFPAFIFRKIKVVRK